jgi:hypothetical protein
MSDPRVPGDDELESRVREAFGRASPPAAPESLRRHVAALAERTDSPRRRPWFGSVPFAFAAVAVLVGASLVAAVLTTNRHSTTQGEEPLAPGATATRSMLTEAEAIEAARAGMAVEVPGIDDATVTGARRDRYANVVDTFANQRSPEPDADHPVWHIDFAPGPDRRGASVVVDAFDGTVLFWATHGG